MKQSPGSFQLIAREEQSRDQWLAAKAAADIGSCVPHDKIPVEERVALVTNLIANLPLEELEFIKLQITFKLQEMDTEVAKFKQESPF
jgi:phospholipid N-methyltransferase